MIKKLFGNERAMRLVRYGIVGVCTTAVNYALLWTLFYGLHIFKYNTANAVAIVGSVLFAYVTNKLIVFRSRNETAGGLAREAAAFFASRALTMLLEWSSLYFIHTVMGVDEYVWGMWTKIGVNVVVLILNFILSQKVVFKEQSK